jgi:hypothetical protein
MAALLAPTPSSNTCTVTQLFSAASTFGNQYIISFFSRRHYIFSELGQNNTYALHLSEGISQKLEM